MKNNQTFLEFKISFLEATTSVLYLKELILIKLRSYGYKIRHFTAIKLDEDSYKEILTDACIEKLEVSFLEDEQNYRIRVFNKV
jgi:hypothetical protein